MRLRTTKRGKRRKEINAKMICGITKNGNMILSTPTPGNQCPGSNEQIPIIMVA